MSNLIDRKIAVQGVRELFSMGECYCDELSIVGMLNGLPSQPKWIPVTEALPDEEKDVLVSVHFDGYKDEYTNYPPSDYVEIASYIDGVWSSVYDEFKMMRRHHHIVAWMEEPKPWRGE